MKPVWPSLPDAMSILKRLKQPAAAKFNGRQAHRTGLTPKPERGLVAIMGTNGTFYKNTFGAFGVVSAGGNWGRLASAAHRWDFKLVDRNEVCMLLFSDDALVLAESEVFNEFF